MENSMELDELKALWSQSNRRLEASLRLNTLMLQQINLQKADSSMRRFSFGLAVETVVNLIALMLVGSFTADHVREPQFFVPAVLIGISAVALVAAGIRAIVHANSIDYDEPVVAIQKQFEQLRLLRVRSTLATLLFAPLMWVPLLIVVARGVFGVDIYAYVSSAWLAANVLFGLAVIPLGILAARRFGNRFGRHSAMRSLADHVAGHSLVAARDSLDTIRRFEEGDEPSSSNIT
jgi:hypothetical protein